MKKMKMLAMLLVLLLTLSACAAQGTNAVQDKNVTDIALGDDQITVNGSAISENAEESVYAAHDIVYYEEGKDFTYGEGTADDAHSAQEAAAHTVVHITKPGSYRISGTLSKGQIAIDLGKDAKEDPESVVTLLLDGADITCTVAPAVIFYNVYECGTDDEDKATKDVDTSAAGARVVLCDDKENTVRGSYVARIYKPDSVELSEDGTEVKDAKKLHKYDGAFYSRMSMEISGERKGSGVLNIHAENEGLDSEMHLTVNGGTLNIFSGNDGINTNEDGISVTTVNGGAVNICVTGETGEGDGIDSNGWLVIKGGTVNASACAASADAGIDSDMGIHILGGTVAAGGHMLDRIEDGGQTYAVFNFEKDVQGGSTLALKDEKGRTVLETSLANRANIIVLSSPDLKAGTYTLYCNEQQMAGSAGMGMGGMGGMMPPEGMPEGGFPQMPEGGMPEGMTPPEGMPEGEMPQMPEGGFMQMPEGMTPPEMPEGGMPEEGQFPQRPEGEMGGRGDRQPMGVQEASAQFVIVEGGNSFSGVREA